MRELYVIHIHGDWSKACKKIEPSLQELNSEIFAKNKHVKYLVFDQTNGATLKASKQLAKQNGLLRLFEEEKHTGEVLFVDKVSRLVLARFYEVADKELYTKTMQDLLAGKKVEGVLPVTKTYEHPKHNLEAIKQAKLYLIKIHHDQCTNCVITAPVFEAVAKDFVKNPDIAFITFDISSPQAIKKTKNFVKILGLMQIYNSEKHSGEVLFVDPATKEIKERLVAEVNRWNYHNIIRRLMK